MSGETREYWKREDAEAKTGRKQCGACRVEQHVSASGWACDEDDCDEPGQHPSDCPRNESDDSLYNSPART